MGDLMASGTNPGTTYTITALDPGVYHEDRVVVTEVGSTYITQMFRVYGAQFDFTLGTWSFQSDVSTAYATVQNPDGSIHYFTHSGANGWLTSAWQGSDNNTVYNAVDFGLNAGGIASDNTNALASLFTSMLTAAAPALGGGTAHVPQYNFPVNASTTGITVPPGPPGAGAGLGGCIIQGLGTGGADKEHTAFHFSITDPSDEAGPFTFLNCSGPHHHTSGGTYLRNIAFEWVSAGYALDTVLYLDYYNGGADSCTFANCATVAFIRGLGMRFRNCTINYYGTTMPLSPNFTAILLSAINCEISGPSELNAKYLLDNATSPATTATCISIGHKVSPAGCNLNKLGPVNTNAPRRDTIQGWKSAQNSINESNIACRRSAGTLISRTWMS
jgi:hypothetical protein